MDPKNYGVVTTDQALAGRGEKQKIPDISKFKELLNAVHDASFPKGTNDDQTRLEWENIEGEVLGCTLSHAIGSGTPFVQIEDDFFNFATPQECVERMIGKELARAIKARGDIIPSFAALKENLNRLIVSLRGLGRDEQIRMLQAFSISLQEQERSETPGSRGGVLRRFG